MICSNCNAELQEGAMFCSNCGTKIETVVPEVTNETVVEAPVEEPVVETVVEAPAEEPVVEAVVEAPAEEPVVEAVAEAPVEEPVQPEIPQAEPVKQEAPKKAPEANGEKKKAPIGLIIGIGAAVVVLLVLVLGGVLISSLFKSSNKQLAYLKDETIYYVKNMEKEDEKAIPVCEVKGESAYASNKVEISEDGKYMYYYSKVDFNYDTYTYNGTLCRIKISKLSDDVDKNEDNEEKISNDVTQYTLLNKGKSVLFRKANGKVVLFNGKDEEDIAKNVDYYYLSEDEEKVILAVDEGDGKDGLYVYNLKTNEELEYSDDYYNIQFRDDECIVFSEEEEDGTLTLYRANYKEEDTKELISGVYSVSGYNDENNSFYYREERLVKRSLYDYIDDPYASQDANLAKPNWMDYTTVSDWKESLSEYDFEYYCVKYPQYQSRFVDWELYYDYNKEAYYYVKYEDDENGDSQRIVSYYDIDNETWYRLDSDAFEAAEDAYEGAEDRINLRAELKTTEFEIENYDLYFWKNGEETLIAENVDDYMYVNSDIIFFTTSETGGNRVSIDNVYSIYDAENQIRYGAYDDYDTEESSENITLSYIVKGNIGSLEVEGEIRDINASEDGKYLVFEMGNNSTECVLDLYSVSGSEVKYVETIEEDAMDGAWVEDTYYYYSDVSDSLGTLYAYKKGKSEKIASNVVASGYQNALFEDGNFMLMDEYDSDGSDYVLLFKNGEKVKFKGIQEYAYIEEDKILYLKNDSLYFYGGKDDDIRIARDVVDYYFYDYEYGSRF